MGDERNNTAALEIGVHVISNRRVRLMCIHKLADIQQPASLDYLVSADQGNLEPMSTGTALSRSTTTRGTSRSLRDH